MLSSSQGLCLTWAFVFSVVSPQFATSNQTIKYQYRDMKKFRVSHRSYQEKSEMRER